MNLQFKLGTLLWFKRGRLWEPGVSVRHLCLRSGEKHSCLRSGEKHSCLRSGEKHLGLRSGEKHLCLRSGERPSQHTPKSSPPWDIMFFGTDDFSLQSLSALHREQQTSGLVGRLDVVSISMKKIIPSVRKYCRKEGIPLQDWPVTVPHGTYDVGIVASFGHLIPAAVIKAFPMGILNVHGSLLPRWRGAAPTIHAVLNNDRETGITIMRIEPRRFDVGKMVSKVTVPISWDTKSGALTKHLAHVGAQELISVLENLTEKLRTAVPQTEEGVTKAPKISEASSKIHWHCFTCHKIQAMYRAFDDYFPLWTVWHGTPIKLRDMVMQEEWSHSQLDVQAQQQREDKREPQYIKEGEAHSSELIKEIIMKNSEEHLVTSKHEIMSTAGMSLNEYNTRTENHNAENVKICLHGTVAFDKKLKVLRVLCLDGWVSFRKVVIKGRKPMNAQDFYNGFMSKISNNDHKFD
nr:methionyl-tRNA formyltransferase, mitochondrial-like isoform X1 [Procambarus clarkii]